MGSHSAEKFLLKAIELESEIIDAGMDIRERSKIACSEDLLYARMMSLAIIPHLQGFRVGIPGTTGSASVID